MKHKGVELVIRFATKRITHEGIDLNPISRNEIPYIFQLVKNVSFLLRGLTRRNQQLAK